VIRSVLYLFLRRVLGLFRSDERAAAEAELEIAILRHQVAILRRQVKRPIYRASDKTFLAAASRMLRREVWSALLVQPETLLRWRRRLVARKWTRPHRPPGPPALDPEVRKLLLRVGRKGEPQGAISGSEASSSCADRWDLLGRGSSIRALELENAVLRHEVPASDGSTGPW